jgi:hypothetical protein
MPRRDRGETDVLVCVWWADGLASPPEAGLGGLKEYLPDDESPANRDIGAFQAGLMRFGAKHNDIFPILA